MENEKWDENLRLPQNSACIDHTGRSGLAVLDVISAFLLRCVILNHSL